MRELRAAIAAGGLGDYTAAFREQRNRAEKKRAPASQCWYNFALFRPKMEMPVLISSAHAQTGSGLAGSCPARD